LEGEDMPKSIGVLVNLPPELDYLIEPAMKYGVYQTEDEKAGFLKTATSKQLEELRRVAERLRAGDDNHLVSIFLDRYPITKYEESANLYFLFGVMDAAHLQFLPVDWDTIEGQIKQLERPGPFRIASKRAHAAKALSEFGEKAKKAIPHLQRALEDEDFRVRVWAHYALAVIEGNAKEHQKAVQKVFSEHNALNEFGEYDFVGSDAIEALELFQELIDKKNDS
jgi:hypothetical protein